MLSGLSQEVRRLDQKVPEKLGIRSYVSPGQYPYCALQACLGRRWRRVKVASRIHRLQRGSGRASGEGTEGVQRGFRRCLGGRSSGVNFSFGVGGDDLDRSSAGDGGSSGKSAVVLHRVFKRSPGDSSRRQFVAERPPERAGKKVDREDPLLYLVPFVGLILSRGHPIANFCSFVISPIFLERLRTSKTTTCWEHVSMFVNVVFVIFCYFPTICLVVFA